MNPYILYAILVVSCIPPYLGWAYLMGKKSIVFKIALYFCFPLIVLCYTSYAFGRTENYYLFVPALIPVFVAFYLLSKNIKKPIELIEKNIREISNGSLDSTTVKDLKKRNDEFGLIAGNLEAMTNQLHQVTKSISEISGDLANVSQQLSDGSNEVSQGASEQASSIEEVSSSIEQMTANVQQNMEHAKSAERISDESNDKIGASLDSTKQTTVSMKEIADKITIINDIAFQTNILALNAAVEAARAGEQGRGFAVVAAEVRKLAEKSKVAAEEIESLSAKGVSNSNVAGEQLDLVAPDIQKTSVFLKEIAAASVEQHSGAEQISTAVQQLNVVTQRNAAASEEMATSAEELYGRAAKLKEVVSYFKIKGGNTSGNSHKMVSTTTAKSNKPAQNIPTGKEQAEKKVAIFEGMESDKDFENF